MKVNALDRTKTLSSPRLSDILFKSWIGAIVFLPVRLYFGYEWIKAGWEKVTDSAWMSSGKALTGFAAGAATRGTAGAHPSVAYGWWAAWLRFLRDATWFTPTFAKVIALGEVVIGVALVIGAFTGIAAFLGATLNFSFMFSGSAGVNPAFLLAEVLLVVAWRVAGQIGADAYLLDKVGTVRQPGTWFRTHFGRTPTPHHA